MIFIKNDMHLLINIVQLFLSDVFSMVSVLLKSRKLFLGVEKFFQVLNLTFDTHLCEAR